MFRLFFIPLMLVALAGCGQSREERHAEAVQRLHCEEKELDRLHAETDAIDAEMAREIAAVQNEGQSAEQTAAKLKDIDSKFEPRVRESYLRLGEQVMRVMEAKMDCDRLE